MKVLVALDDSPISLRAAREAARLFVGADFLVVNVNRRVVPWIGAGEFGAVYPVSLTDLPSEGLHEDELLERAHEAGIDHAQVQALEGDPAMVICDAAELHDVDVLVVGSHDRGVLRRLLSPSVADAVVHGTYRPVLVVSGEAPK